MNDLTFQELLPHGQAIPRALAQLPHSVDSDLPLGAPDGSRLHTFDQKEQILLSGTDIHQR
jgi:hypothetical protein